MAETGSPLHTAFLEDHRVMTQGLYQLLGALENDDLPTAVELAEHLNQKAGPHIEFEETVLYPQVAHERGLKMVERLYQEHKTAFEAIRFLIEHKAAERLEPNDKERLLAQVQIALDHATTCGTLVSHITVLNPERQAELLERLLKIREQGHAWSELIEQQQSFDADSMAWKNRPKQDPLPR